MTGSTATAAPQTATSLGQFWKVIAVMAAVLALAAFIAFGPLAGDSLTPAIGDRPVDYALRHLGETSEIEVPRTADYGVRHLASPDRSSAVDYPLRHLGR